MPTENFPFGYCTNVHAGTSLAEAKSNLLLHAAAVRQSVVAHAGQGSSDAPATGNLPVGLWLAEPAATSLIEESGVHEFGHWLSENHFTPYTMNGFPQGDFHQPVVKHAVYEPTWSCDSRTRYTLELAEILDAILPADGIGNQAVCGSISTLPLGWPHAPWHAENYKNAADNLLEVAKFLDRQAQRSGKQVVIAIEPEPGCVLNTAGDMVEFFEHYLFSGPDAKLARQYLTVCHDICHSGVMFEPQQAALQLYRQAGMRVGKVQVSSAVHVPWDACEGDPDRREATVAQLRTFVEPKYLHQTTRQNRAGRLDQLCSDLPTALEKWLPASASAQTSNNAGFPVLPWRIHFHVPIFVDTFECLKTTQADIAEATIFLEQHAQETVEGQPWFTGHYEVETYAWPVLPAAMSVENLADGIAQELQYFETVLSAAAVAASLRDSGR